MDVSIGWEKDVSFAFPETVERRRMSLEEFEALPDEIHAEYADGVAIMSPPSTEPHNWIADEIRGLLRAALPDLRPTRETGVRLGPSQARRIPDVTVLRARDSEAWTRQVPMIVVEVLSASTRTEDLFRKPDDYRRAGVAQYWIVDPDQGTLTVLSNAGDSWDVLLELDAEHPRGEVAVGEYGVVVLDLERLLAP